MSGNLRSWHHPPVTPEVAQFRNSLLGAIENGRNETYTMADAVFSGEFPKHMM